MITTLVITLIIFLLLQDATAGCGADVIVKMLPNASLTKDLQVVVVKGRIGVCLT